MLAYCTCAIVQTRVGETVVDRAITELASVATLTHTPETIHLILHVMKDLPKQTYTLFGRSTYTKDLYD